MNNDTKHYKLTAVNFSFDNTDNPGQSMAVQINPDDDDLITTITTDGYTFNDREAVMAFAHRLIELADIFNKSTGE